MLLWCSDRYVKGARDVDQDFHLISLDGLGSDFLPLPPLWSQRVAWLGKLDQANAYHTEGTPTKKKPLVYYINILPLNYILPVYSFLLVHQ